MTSDDVPQVHGAPADLELAHRLADHADAIAARYFASGDIVWQAKSDDSPVTVADREIERAVRTLINQERVDDAFLGEEFGAHGHGRRRWIVDAIDGTASFLAGEPEWGTLIALAEGDAVSLGVVTAAACRTRWWAVRGSGAWCASLPMGPAATPTRLAVTAAADLRDAAIGIWPPPARLDARDRRRAANLAMHVRTTLPALDWHSTHTPTATVRKPSTGSGTCHGALLVATGKLDAFLLQGVGPWDIAALVPIVEEAGGVYSDLSDDRHGDTRSALFSAPALHHQILDIAVGTT
ncbi:inositol monophosphatase family protein [Actinophytocola gossypii]|uniref:Histidinol-phosphatase n=1 Tax=Actinophytocola gossypii TaxID=2812003 RepID=A0ABT2JDC2_9PSEU|nr:inositol monophosphatase family protein [Actinophytocola gossypii]MCT2585869.1 histidinol-phosphatase [Actinophytocola gossypii]